MCATAACGERRRPEQRLDLSSLVPHLISGRSVAEIERIELQTTRWRVSVGDVFRLRMGDPERIRIEGSCDRLDRIGAPLAGEMAGMRGGLVIVRGRTGERAGDRMRRGTIVIEGEAGAYAGSRMIAGSLLVAKKAGPLPGYLMKRGSIVLGAGCEAISPTFVDCGSHELLAMRLWAGFVHPYSKKAAVLLRRPLQRLAGDMAVLGKGEIFIGSPN